MNTFSLSCLFGGSDGPYVQVSPNTTISQLEDILSIEGYNSEFHALYHGGSMLISKNLTLSELGIEGGLIQSQLFIFLRKNQPMIQTLNLFSIFSFFPTNCWEKLKV